MKTLTFVLAAASLLTACAPEAWREAHYVDREFGKAQQITWDMLVAYPDAPHAAKIPEGMNGIVAEEVMDVYTKAFADRPKKVQVLELGVVSRR